MPAEETTSARGWAMAGLGTFDSRISQTIPGVATLEQTISGSFTQHLAAGYRTSSNWGAQVGYTYIPTVPNVFADVGFKYSEMTAEFTGLIPTTLTLFNSTVAFGMNLGAIRRASTLFTVDPMGEAIGHEIARQPPSVIIINRS